MAVHPAAAASVAPAVGKRLWSYVRAALFVARNGVLSHKRRLLLSMHLLAANKRKAVQRMRTVANLLSVSHHGHHAHHGNTAYEHEYEFSCSNSPAAEDHSSSSRRRLAYFPCLGAVPEHEHEHGYQYDGEPAPALARIQYYASTTADDDEASSQAPGEELEEEYAYDACASASASASPAALVLLTGASAASGEFSTVRVSNYSSEDENEAGVGGDQAVDADAEEFIRRFYDQLRRQNTVAAAQMLPYQCHHHTQQQESAIAAA